ncbi:hypothetical protein NCCP2222_15800 [Sporosarcina sp. NCCP-2222]|nr:hypothetical protein NCCP2222_15800 [Sporosarcina sp. NCCP-2222]
MFNGKEFRFLKGAGELRVYTFTMPKFLSSFVRKCMVVMNKEEKQATASSNNRTKKKKKEKTPG